MDGLDQARQKELERIEYERQWAERAAREREATEQQKRQIIENRLQILEEVKQIAVDFKIRDRLAYINATIWEGKGQIKNILIPPESTISNVNSDMQGNWRDPLVGFELAYSYQSAIEERVPVSWGRAWGYNWRLVPGMEETSLLIAIQSYDSYGARSGLLGHYVVEREGKVLAVRSSYAEGDDEVNKRRNVLVYHSGNRYSLEPWKEDYVVRIGLDSLDKKGTEGKLDQILIHESTVRAREGVVPSKLILVGQEKLRQAKASAHWMKWEYVETQPDDGP